MSGEMVEIAGDDLLEKIICSENRLGSCDVGFNFLISDNFEWRFLQLKNILAEAGLEIIGYQLFGRLDKNFEKMIDDRFKKVNKMENNLDGSAKQCLIHYSLTMIPKVLIDPIKKSEELWLGRSNYMMTNICTMEKIKGSIPRNFVEISCSPDNLKPCFGIYLRPYAYFFSLESSKQENIRRTKLGIPILFSYLFSFFNETFAIHIDDTLRDDEVVDITDRLV